MFNPIPASVAEIDADWLNTALGAEGNPAAGSVTRCTTRMLETEGNTGWYALADIETETGSGLPPSLFFKVAEEYGLSLTSQYRNYATEIAFYRDIAPTGDARFLQMLYGAADKETDSGIVVLEAYDTAKTLSTLKGISLEETSLALKSLANLQAKWCDRELPRSLSVLGGSLREVSTTLVKMFSAEWSRYRRPMRRHLPESACDALDRLAADGGASLGPAFEWTQTITQLDCRAENIAILDSVDGNQAVIFDWQRATKGPLLFDVASLIGTSVEPENQPEVPRLLEQYLSDLHKWGAVPPGTEQAMDMLRICAEIVLLARTTSGMLSRLKEWAETGFGTPPENWHFKTIVRSAHLVDRLS